MNIFEGFEGAKIVYTAKTDGNLADYVGDVPDAVAANREKLTKELGARVVILKQVHGDTILELNEGCGMSDGENGFVLLGEGDGMVSNQKNVYLAIQTADCAPVMMYDPVNLAIAALHAGRKGAELNILTKCIELMGQKYGSNPSNLKIFIGSCIGGELYELPKEMAAGFEIYENAVSKLGDSYFLDIKTVLLSQAKTAGVESKNIEINPDCSAQNNDKYFSYRAEEGKCGRMITAIGVLWVCEVREPF